MPKPSAGLLLYRRSAGALELFLVHPGGPFWAKKDLGAWSIPKGELEPDEDPLAAACRETTEETGYVARPPFVALAPVRQKSGKVVHAWLAEASDFDAAAIQSNTFELEWPPRSGRTATFPEVDRAGWFSADEARARILPGQLPLVEEAVVVLARFGEHDSRA